MEGDLRLSANERVLVCGSGEAGAWRDVPLPQAQYQLGVLLQRLGYFQPRFERRQDRLWVWAGPRGEIKSFEVEGAAGVLDPDKKRKVLGDALTPEKLDEIENWADMELRTKGFACPAVDVSAQAWDGHVVARARPGERQRVASLRRVGFGSLDDDALKRYEAVEVGREYSVLDTQLTASRMLADGLVQSAYFTSRCRGREVDLILHATLGEPRLLTFGVGASTEEFPFVDIRFKNTRLDDRASSVTSTVHASPILQSWNTTSELYVLPWSARTFLGPRFLAKREAERTFEVLSAELGADLGRSWDMWHVRLLGRVGPTLNYVNTVKGVGPDDVSYLSWEGSLRFLSHEYEVFIRDQVVGWEGTFEYRGQREGLGSYLNVDRYEWDFKHIWNIGAYAPPLFVLASRMELIGVDAGPVVTGPGRDILPTDYRIFYGGDQNLRGFNRLAINNEELGYLTAAYFGFELRLIEELPWRLQPFLLYDFAKLGNRRYALDDPIFSSSGFGLRWVSPFGTLRGSAAKGRIFEGNETTDGYPQEWVFFLSFGREF